MPDPSWTAEYNTGNTPEQNGFTRTLINTPTITEVVSGNPANRRVEVNTDNGDVAFITSSVPSLDPSVGATAEANVQVNGAGDAGFELTFLDAAVLVNIYEDHVDISIPGSGGGDTTFSTASNGDGDHLWRYTFDSSRNVRLYRDGVLVGGPIAATTISKPFQRVLWYAESGGTQIFRGFRYYTGGAVAPG